MMDILEMLILENVTNVILNYARLVMIEITVLSVLMEKLRLVGHVLIIVISELLKI